MPEGLKGLSLAISPWIAKHGLARLRLAWATGHFLGRKSSPRLKILWPVLTLSFFLVVLVFPGTAFSLLPTPHMTLGSEQVT